MKSTKSKVGITPSFEGNTKPLWRQTLVRGCWPGTDCRAALRELLRGCSAALLSLSRNFIVMFKKLGQSCPPCLRGSPSFPGAEVFPGMMLLQKILLLQLPPVSDITDFSHLTQKHLGFSAPTFSPCQLLCKSVSLHDLCL